jgi:hypothetical protein
MAQSSDGVRYSQGTKDIGKARNFSWEYPVPRNKFWDDLPYTVARNFLSLFSQDEQPPSFDDAESIALNKTQKLQLLLKLLNERLASRDAAAAPQSLYGIDHQVWERTWLAIAGIQHELQDPAEEQTLLMLIERRKDPSNLSHYHSLSGFLLDKGRYAEAERFEAPVRDWLDSKLGKESPQSLSARRILVQAVWMQGRQAEGERLMVEVDDIIRKTSDDSPYAMYRDEQRALSQELWAKLKGEGAVET